jgi:LacI family transcriptional regulator
MVTVKRNREAGPGRRGAGRGPAGRGTPRRTVTQKDIAGKLGVSVMTVSKALAGHPDVSEATRERVLGTAREMRYTVNVLARSLVQRRTRTIGVVVPDISEPFYAEMIRAIEGCLRGHGYDLLLADSTNDPATESRAVRTLVEKRVDGCILGPTERAEEAVDLLRGAGVPFVLVNAPSTFRDCDAIGTDRADGARQSIRHLIDCGYDDLYYLHTFPRLEQSREALRGCLEAMAAAGWPRGDLRLVACPEHSLECFHAAAREHVRDRGRRIGLFVWDDEMAVGVLRAVGERGWDVPSKAGVVGFDDLRVSRFLPKALTTVSHPKAEMGRRAADRLIEVLGARRPPSPRRLQLPVALVARETTAPLSGRSPS